MDQILLHLKECDDHFIPPLSKKVDLMEYSKKIHDKAITFEAWEGDVLSGLVAAYLNDPTAGFITNVSVDPKYTGKGIASRLMEMCFQYAREKKITEIKLEVNKNNRNVIRLYKKIGFEELDQKDDNIQMQISLQA